MWSDPAAIGVQTGYANLRQVLGDRYAALPDAAIRAQMEAALGPEAAEQYEEYLEGMFDDIGRAFSSAAGNVAHFVTKAAPVVATVGGGALQGALAGSSAGLPGIHRRLGGGRCRRGAKQVWHRDCARYRRGAHRGYWPGQSVQPGRQNSERASDPPSAAWPAPAPPARPEQR